MSQPRRSIDLNADLGEGCPQDEALLDRVTSASLCCGAYASDRATILRSLRAASLRDVIVGAHPGFADREGFGRREQHATAWEVEQLILAQVKELAELAVEVGLTLRFVKPHGALYNQAQNDREIAEGVLSAVKRLGLPVLGQPGSVLAMLAEAQGTRFLAEGFPDRRYRADGRLVPRSDPGAILVEPDAIEAQVVRLVEQGLDTLCVHGDDPRAVANADSIRAILRRHQITLRSFDVREGETNRQDAKTPRKTI